MNRWLSFLGWGSAWLLVMAATSLAAAQETPSIPPETVLSEVAYWDLVAQTLSGVSDLELSVEDRQTLLNSWRTAAWIELEGGAQLPLSTAHIQMWLAADPFDPEPLIRNLTALNDLRQTWPTSPFADPDAAAAAFGTLDDILAQERYAVETTFAEELWQRFLDWLPEGSDRLSGGEVIFDGVRLLTMIGALAVIVLIAVLLIQASSGLVGDAVTLNDKNRDALPLTAREALVRAESVAGSGDLRSAVRFLYLSTLLMLDEKDVLRFDRSLTNREVVRAVSDQPRLAGVMRDVVDVFDRVWYGFDSIDQPTFERYRRRVDELQRQKGDDQ